MSSAAADRLLGPPVAHLAVGPPPPPAHQPEEDRLDLDGADWPTYGNPCVAFFLADGNTPPQRLRALLAAASNHDALTALKLVCNLRGVRGTGRGDREGFYTAALWMHQNHPLILAANLGAFADFGYIKDLPELLYRLVKGADVRKVEKAKAEAWTSANKKKKEEAALVGSKRGRGDPVAPSATDDTEPTTRGIKATGTGPEEQAEVGVRSQPPTAADDDDKVTHEEIPSAKALKVAGLATRALHMYNFDEAYRFLFDCVADFFADRLKSDLDKVAAGKRSEIGLAAKWCPSPDSAFDQATLLCEAIARRLLPNSNPDAADPQQESRYVYRALRHLRRDVLTPLRHILQLPELYISDKRWSELPYNHVANKAMERYHKTFLKHDGKRYKEYLAAREARKAKIADTAGAFTGGQPADATLPHDIVRGLVKHARKEWDYLLAWRRLVHYHRGNGLFRNCLAVCDLSDSMRGRRRHVCLGLGLLVSELADDPWTHLLCPLSVSTLPQILPDDLNISDRLDTIEKIDCNDKRMDLRAIFDFVLGAGCQPDKMIQTIFVLTDQDFAQSMDRPWTPRAYRVICDKFTDLGYANQVPQVVYWNLAGPRSAALTSTRDGVMTISGFSDSFFRLFLQRGGIVGPDVEMHESIKGSEYDKLTIELD